MPKETTKTFLLFFCVAAIIVLSFNTYMQNQQAQVMQQQIKQLQDLLIHNQELINNNKNILGNLSQDTIK